MWHSGRELALYRQGALVSLPHSPPLEEQVYLSLVLKKKERFQNLFKMNVSSSFVDVGYIFVSDDDEAAQFSELSQWRSRNYNQCVCSECSGVY